jgi:hypothetical protein
MAFKTSTPDFGLQDLRERGFFENLSNAYAYQYSPLVTRTQEFLKFEGVERDPNYDFREDIEGYELHTEDLYRAKNKEHANFIKSQINSSQRIRNELDKTSWYYPSQLIAGIVDPVNVAFALPVAGQLGLLARGGMTVRQAATASAKGGFAAGLAGEATRAPFDPLATKAEVGMTLAASTALGSLFGSIPSIYKNMRVHTEDALNTTKDMLTDRGDFVGEVEGYTVSYVRGADQEQPVKVEKDQIEINEDVADAQYDAAVWTLPEVEGATPFNPGDIKSRREYKDFLVHKELVRSQVKRTPGESDASYVDRVNKLAYERTIAGEGLKKTVATENIFYRALSTPAKRILLNDKIPDAVKRIYSTINGNAAMATARNVVGRGYQSIMQRAPVHQARGDAMLSELRTLYDKEVLVNLKSVPPLVGMDASSVYTFTTDKLSFEQWFNDLAKRYIEFGEDWDVPNRYDSLSDVDKKSFTILREFFKDYEDRAVELNLFKGQKDVQDSIANLKEKIENAEAEIEGIQTDKGKRGMTKKQQGRVAKLEETIARLRNDLEYNEALLSNGIDRAKFYFPIYYDKLKLRDPEQREAFTNIIEEHVQQNPKKLVWDRDSQKMVERNPAITDREIAEGIVRTIMEEAENYTPGTGLVGSKHTRMRTLDIPEWKVKDFIIRDQQVISAYTRKMGQRIEWARNFGKKNIDDILDEAEELMYQDGKLTPKEIAGVRRDLLADYEYTMGMYRQNPDRWDQQVIDGLKDIAGLTYLNNAGVAALGDLGAVVFEHGFRRTLDPLISNTKSELYGLAVAEQKKIVRGLEIALNSQGKMRLVSDNITRVVPNAKERVLNPITNAFYNIPLIGNNLGIITRYGRIIDAVLRQSHYIERIKRIASGKTQGDDIEYMARYGLELEDCKEIAEFDAIIQDGNFYFANVSNWPQATPRQRELRFKWEAAMDRGLGNTIMFATAFDKPIITRGVVYVKENWATKQLGYKPDKQASTRDVNLVRIENGMMTAPFQFWDFGLAATNRITASLADPARMNRVQGALALFGMAYIAQKFRQPDWWFESKDNVDIIARTFDFSGIAGVYSDIAYSMLHVAIGIGAVDPEYSIIGGKYRPNGVDASLEFAGAAPGMVAEWLQGVNDLLNGRESEGAKRIAYNTPTGWVSLFGMDRDFREGIRETLSGN